MLEIILIVIGFIILILGMLGCILPVIPGPPLSYLAIIILSFAKNWEPFSTQFLIIMAIITVLVTLVDYFVPILGAKRYGATRAGIWGSVAGLLIGTFAFPPFGMFIGAFLGALIGEFLVGRTQKEALRASWGVFWGTMLGLGLKLMVSGVITYYYVYALIKA